ncbi:MAG: AraC family transcriptional regulator [Salinisphaera sp.]|jgi:AraC-like DNA-binding protein|nr:AraC family transcriptional regulator [Salinisphaera sp.]
MMHVATSARHELADRYARLGELIAPHVRCDGYTASNIEGVTLMASHASRARTPLVYAPGLIFVAQGKKTGYLDDRVIHYGAGHYLVQAMPLPFECETGADADHPLLGAVMRIEPAVLAELAAAMPNPQPDERGADSLPMAAVSLDSAMLDVLERLLACLDDPQSAAILGASRRREVLFEALRGPQGRLLRQLVQDQGAYARVARAIDRLHADFTMPLAVDRLAAEAHMSASTFHAHFKRVTRLSPLQYQKRIRLLHARHLLASRVENVAGAAMAVGYQSASQFSREYKRYFGVAPALDAEIVEIAAI